MTSSKFLKSGLRKSFAFPILLVAVGLMLASLVLSTNLVRALGADSGICDYTEVIRDAILANNDQNSYDCDADEYTADAGTDLDVWGGEDSDGNPNDLDLSGANSFAPKEGELDGFEPGARIDLRGTGLTVADLDVDDAAKSDNANYTNFRDSLTVADTGVGIAVLLDGGSDSSNGLALDTYEATEGGILWVTFEYGAPPESFEYPDDGSKSAWMRVDVTVEHDDVTPESPNNPSTVSIMVNSGDGAGTLYAVPVRIPDDFEIEDERAHNIDISFVHAGTFENARDGTGVALQEGLGADLTFEFNEDEFDSSIERTNENAKLTVIDNDTPGVLVADRQEAVIDAIRDDLDAIEDDANVAATNKPTSTNKTKISKRDLTLIDVLAIGKNDDGRNDGDPISSINVADLSGLTGITELDLSDNDLTELPSGLFADVGTDAAADLSTKILLDGNDGPDGAGFTLANISAAGDGLSAGQVLVFGLPDDDDSTAGLTESSYEAVEDGAWVFDINIREADNASGGATDVAIQFVKTQGDSGSVEAGVDVNVALIPLGNEELGGPGHYRVAIGLPKNDDEDTDRTLTALIGHSNAADSALDTVFDVVRLTIRDESYEAPAPEPVAPESSFDSVVVTGNEFQMPDGSPHLNHNISNLLVTVGGNAVNADFLTAYNATGGLARWGLATSEVVEIEDGTLTQFFQRGVLDFHDVGAGYIVERRLAWDYFGGGLGGSTDQGVEDAPDVAPEGGVQVGAFGHYVANVDADGNTTGFLDLFNSLGGVDSFGFPKTEARADTGAEGTLSQADSIGLTRQYFQAAVFQITPGTGLAELTLLGDDLRDDVLVPGHADEAAFSAAEALSVGDPVSPPVISS